MTRSSHTTVLIVCTARFFSVGARLDPNLLKNIKCARVTVIEMMHIVKQSKLDGLQAHITVLEHEKCIYYVTHSPYENIITSMTKNHVLAVLLEHYYMFAFDTSAK